MAGFPPSPDAPALKRDACASRSPGLVYPGVVDEELRRLRRDASGDELVLALARAGLEAELVAEHGTRTRAGGEVGALVERAWETALGRLVRRSVPTAPVATGSVVVALEGEHAALVDFASLRFLCLTDGAVTAPRPLRGCARVDRGTLFLDADGQSLTLLTARGCERLPPLPTAARTRDSGNMPGYVQGEWLWGARSDGEWLVLRDQLLGGCTTRIVRAASGDDVEDFGGAHDVRISWARDRVLIHDGGLRTRRLSRPDERPVVVATGRVGRFQELDDGRLLTLEGRLRLLGSSPQEVAGPGDLVTATLAPDGEALLALDARARVWRLPFDARGEPASWLEEVGGGWGPLDGVARPEAAWHPWASAALVTTAAGCDVVGLDGRLLASLGPDRHGLGWSPDGRTALVVHAPNGAQAGALEAWGLR